jgi:hypothetical protein
MDIKNDKKDKKDKLVNFYDIMPPSKLRLTDLNK